MPRNTMGFPIRNPEVMTQIITFQHDDLDLLEGHVNQWLGENSQLKIRETFFDIYNADHLTYPKFVYVIHYEEEA